MKNVFEEKISKIYCSNCGACIYICPVKALTSDINLPLFSPEKCIDCGLCLKVCPSNIALQSIDVRNIFNNIEGYSVRTTLEEIKAKAQNGGAVTSLILTALEEDEIKYVLICGGMDFKPKPIFTNNVRKVISSAGSKYFYAPILAEIDKNIFRKYPIGIVGLPCHLRALREIENIIKRKVKLKISLFCWRNYFYKYFEEIILKAGLEDYTGISKIEIIDGKYVIEKVDGSSVSIDVKELTKYSGNACDKCGELFSPHADIAVGNIGSERNWSTVLILTKFGKKIYEKCLEKGYILTKPLPRNKMELIKRLYIKKRKRIKKYL